MHSIINSSSHEQAWYLQLPQTKNVTIDPLRNFTILTVFAYHMLALLRIDPDQAQLASIPTTGLLIALFNLVTGEVGTRIGNLVAAAYLLFAVGMTFIAPLGRHDKWTMVMFCIYAVGYFHYSMHI